jgi:hypothetical protein
MSDQAIIEAMGVYHLNMRAARVLANERAMHLANFGEKLYQLLQVEGEFVFDAAAMTAIAESFAAAQVIEAELRAKLSLADGAALTAGEPRPVIVEVQPVPPVAQRVTVLDVPSAANVTDTALSGGN